MNIFMIAKMPTEIGKGRGGQVYHESCLRSYHILSLVRDWLEKGVPAPVILEVVAQIEAQKPGKEAEA